MSRGSDLVVDARRRAAPTPRKGGGQRAPIRPDAARQVHRGPWPTSRAAAAGHRRRAESPSRGRAAAPCRRASASGAPHHNARLPPTRKHDRLGPRAHWTIDWCSQSRSAQVDVARATWGISRESYPPRRWCSALPGASPPGQARVGPDEPDDALRCHSRTPACSPSGRVALRWARSERAARVAQQPGTAFSWRACRWGTVAVFTLAWVLFLVVAGVTVLRAT